MTQHDFKFENLVRFLVTQRSRELSMTALSSSTPELSDKCSKQASSSSQLGTPFKRDSGYIGLRKFDSTGAQEPERSQKRDIRALKDEILKNRLGLRELRTDIGQQRAKIREMEARLWKELQRHRNDPKDLSITVIDQLYEDISQALDLIGPSEEDYDEKEDELNILEFKLEGLEAELDSTTGSPENSIRPRSFRSCSNSQSPIAMISFESPKEEIGIDSPMRRYSSKLGDARIIEERLYELRSEKSQYLDIQRDRETLDHPQYQPNVDFLADFEKMYNEEFSQLQIVQMELINLAHEAGVKPPLTIEMPLQPMCTYSPRVQMNDPSEHTAANSTDHPETSQLTTSPLGPESFSEMWDARRRINDWILHNLRISPLERARHMAIMGNPDLDGTQWARLVEKYW